MSMASMASGGTEGGTDRDQGAMPMESRGRHRWGAGAGADGGADGKQKAGADGEQGAALMVAPMRSRRAGDDGERGGVNGEMVVAPLGSS
ncbi:hypothetical protein GUJ93_ZPchr0008g12521 [Zizania palustris]|uniref:Uncharacterized protein n=1 Tax=Zizania palustris TaxID=103762 RepID=A0A8J5RBX3_ZIZPA|nr:hypothetical protein GUJ93_ZPchr0008g12521 [Zizania palustris]